MLTTVLVNVVMTALCVGVIFAGWMFFTRKERNEDSARDAIKATGTKVWATVISTKPTGESTGSDTQVQYKVQYYVLLELDVPQPGGTLARCTIKDLPAPSWHALSPGDQVQVYQDPTNPTQVALDTIMTPHYADRRAHTS